MARTAPGQPSGRASEAALIGGIIRDARTACSPPVTQTQLGGRLRPVVTQQAVSQWERGRATPSLDELSHISRALGLSAEELFCRFCVARGWDVRSMVSGFGIRLTGNVDRDGGLMDDFFESFRRELKRVYPDD